MHGLFRINGVGKSATIEDIFGTKRLDTETVLPSGLSC